MNARIVLMLAAFPQPSETFIVSKFAALAEQGWDVHIVCNQHRRAGWESFPQYAGLKGLHARVHQSWPAEPKWLALLLFPLVFFICLFKNPGGLIRYLARGARRHGVSIFKRFYIDSPVIALRPDLVHFEFGATAVGRADINHLLGCVEVVSFRGYDLNFSGLDQPGYYDEVWRHADAFHFLGEDLHQRALRRGLPADKPFALIPPAIDTDYFAPTSSKHAEIIGSAERPLRLLSVGRLEWKKGYEHAFAAVRLLREQGIHCAYRVIGAGGYLEPLAFARHQLGLEREITFLGEQTRERVRVELEWADVFLHAAVSEGFCNAVLEAQAMGVPVVTSDADGLAENVEDGVTGFVVPRRDPAAMAARAVQLSADADLRGRMGNAGRERVVRKFILRDQIRKFEVFYSNLLNHA